MLVIRLARTGRTKYPTYRIVAADSARTATGRFVAQLGHYNPHTKELVIKHDETKAFMANGAQPSNTVVKLLQRDGVELPKWVKLKTKTKPVEPVAADEPSEAEIEADADTEAPITDAEASAAEAAEPRVATVAEAAVTDTADDAGSMATQETAASEDAVETKTRDAEDKSDAAASPAK